MPGTFIITTVGKELVVGDHIKFENMIGPRLESFAPGYLIEKFSFAGLKYRYEMTGIPTQFEFIDNLQKSLLIYMKRYFRKWELDIEVNYTERGEMNGA